MLIGLLTVREETIYVRITIILVPVPIDIFNVFEGNRPNQHNVNIALLACVVIGSTQAAPLVRGKHFPTETDKNTAMISADKISAKPRRDSLRSFVDARIAIDPLHIANDDVVAKLLLVRCPNVRLEFSFPFSAKLDYFRSG